MPQKEIPLKNAAPHIPPGPVSDYQSAAGKIKNKA